MHDEVRRAALAGEAEMIRVELMPIESEAELHKTVAAGEPRNSEYIPNRSKNWSRLSHSFHSLPLRRSVSGEESSVGAK
jgi:hypothetical protein